AGGRPVRRDALPGVRDHGVGSGVSAAYRPVEDQDGRIGQEAAGDGQQLFLPGRDVRGVVGQHGVVPLWQRPHERVDVGGLRGGHDLLGGRADFPVPDVVADGAGEDPGVLKHHAEDAADIVAAEVARVDAVEADAAV